MSICGKCLFSLAVITAVPALCAQSIKTADVTFTTIDVPGAVLTSVQGINSAGDMVGYYGPSSGPYHGFILSGSNVASFDYPSAVSTLGEKINDSGLIVGYTDNGSSEGGFTYDGTTFTAVQHGLDSATICLGIGNSGDIVGGAVTPGATRGFELRGTRFRRIAPSGNFVYVYATDINSLGEVVGWTASGLNAEGFANKRGKFQTLAVSGAAQTEAWGINDAGIVVGWYQVGSNVYGFALMNGTYISLQYPGAKATFAEGINTSGEIVGSYTFDYNTYHGFITSPISFVNIEQ